MQSQNTPPTQVRHELTCSKNCRVGEVKEAEQYENRGGVCCKGQGWRVGGDHKRWKKSYHEEIFGGVCP